MCPFWINAPALFPRVCAWVLKLALRAGFSARPLPLAGLRQRDDPRAS